MRRVAFVLLSMLIVFSCTACAAQKIKPEDINFCFHCKADVVFNDEQFSCELTRNAPSRAAIQFLSGDLSGLTYDWSGEGFSLIYSGMTAKSEDCVLPDSSFAVVLLKILDYSERGDSLTETHGNELSGCMDDCDFTMTVDKNTGQISTISVPQKKLEVKFFNYTEI